MRFSPKQSQKECFQIGYMLGAETEFAYFSLENAVKTIVNIVGGISDSVVVTESVQAVKDWQPQILRAFIAKKGKTLTVDKMLLNAVYDLQRCAEKAQPLIEMYSVYRLDKEQIQRCIDCARDFTNGVFNLMDADSPQHDDGESLRAAMERHALEDIERDLEAMRELRLKVGADKSPVIDRLCERAKPLLERGYTAERALDQMTLDTEHDPDAQDEFMKLANWSVASFNKAYRSRYS